jgi:hypothetical protein
MTTTTEASPFADLFIVDADPDRGSGMTTTTVRRPVHRGR